MSLSDSERRTFEELEAQLRESDPAFARKISRPGIGQFSTRKLVLGTLLFLAGIASLLFGISTDLLAVGVLGFVLMGTGAYIAATKVEETKSSRKNVAGKPAKSSFMKGLEDSWEERRRNEGR